MEFEGEFVADYPFSLFGTKSMVSIIAMTPCDIYIFPVREIVKRMNEDVTIKDTVIRTSEAVFSTVYERYIAIHCKSPLQRYEELVSRHPDIFSHFSLKDIASFLNITPIHLSRIRKIYKFHRVFDSKQMFRVLILLFVTLPLNFKSIIYE